MEEKNNGNVAYITLELKYYQELLEIKGRYEELKRLQQQGIFYYEVKEK